MFLEKNGNEHICEEVDKPKVNQNKPKYSFYNLRTSTENNF